MNEYKIFHVTRNLAKHSFELDDAIHGSPLQKEYRLDITAAGFVFTAVKIRT